MYGTDDSDMKIVGKRLQPIDESDMEAKLYNHERKNGNLEKAHDIGKFFAESLMNEDGFAYEVAKNAKLGSYALNGEIDNITVSGLLSLGFNLDFIFFIEKVRYMFPKHHAIVCLKYDIAFMWYKIHFRSEFEKIMKGESNDKN